MEDLLLRYEEMILNRSFTHGQFMEATGLSATAMANFRDPSTSNSSRDTLTRIKIYLDELSPASRDELEDVDVNGEMRATTGDSNSRTPSRRRVSMSRTDRRNSFGPDRRNSFGPGASTSEQRGPIDTVSNLEATAQLEEVGFVYVLSCDGSVKVGFSVEPLDRLASLQTFIGNRGSLVFQQCGTRWVEQEALRFLNKFALIVPGTLRGSEAIGNGISAATAVRAVQLAIELQDIVQPQSTIDNVTVAVVEYPQLDGSSEGDLL